MPGASPSGFGPFPIRYSNGEIRLVQKDIEGTGYGTNWSHTRTYQSRHYLFSWGSPCDPIDSDCSPTIYDGPNGANWYSSDWPYLILGDPSVINVRGDANNTLWFDRQPDGSYVARFGQPQTLVHDTVNHMFVLTGLDGGVTRFNDIDQSTYPHGLFSSFTDAAGNVTRVTAYGTNTTIGEIAQIQRSVTINGVTSTQTFNYTYDWSGRLNLVSLQSTTGAVTTNVAKAAYTYVGNVYEFANLRSVERFNWTNGAWESLGTTYYRYSNTLFLAPLQFVVGPQGYADLIADGLNPDTATDAEILTYSDNYFMYDTQGRVVTETVDRGTLTYRYTYARSTFPRDYNNWKFKTTESLPDGNVNIIYTNYAGMVILKVYLASSSGSSSSSSSSSGHSPAAWYEFYRYNSNGMAILTASSAAVLGYDESIATLLNYNALTGTYQYLNNSSGLISKYTYHSPTNWLATETVQEGQLGTPVPIRSKSYVSCCTGGSSSSSGTGVASCRYLLSQETVYSDDAGTHPITTSYAYTYHPGTCAVKQMTTTFPVVSTGQNGSGVADTRKDCFDTYGNHTWMMDERGFITRLVYDIPTGAIIQRIDDVDTSLVTDAPAGWSTPVGGGQHLITDYSIDIQGRTIRSLSPTHTIDLNGTATSIRRATWIIYQDGDFQTWTGQGYATGTSPSYSFTLINPVQITITNATGNVTEQISATRGSGVTSSGALLSTDTFAQSSYVRWTTTQYLACCFIAGQRVYKLIPTTGIGVSGTNYDESGSGYDVMKRLNRQVTPGGTITRTVYERRGFPVATWVGTNDTGATDIDPSGGSASGNNMVQVTGLEYDSGLTGGNGNITRQTDYVDSTPTNNRATTFFYDFRSRRTAIDGEIDFYQRNTYDNLNHLVRVDGYNTTAGGTLISRRETKYDDQGRVYQSITYAVDPSTGTVGNSLTDNNWYDASGNLIKSFPAGSQLFTKMSYDGVGRSTVQYSAYGPDSTYADASSVANNTVLEQAETSYDPADNVIQSTTRQRYHNAIATQTGALQDPNANPKARVSYVAQYSDALGRTISNADYGTNGGSALSRSATTPTRSDTVLVATFVYDAAGNVLQTTDPAAMTTRLTYDDLGRKLTVTENYIPSSSSSSSSGSGTCAASDDTNRVTQYTFTADGQIATLTAQNAQTGPQVTTYTYGTTLTESRIATSNLLRYVDYPGSISGSDRVAYTYNRQQQQASVTDQRGCIHQSVYDLLGRLTNDCVTTLGAGVDGAVRRLAMAYEVRGMVTRLTSYDNATVGSGNIVNDVALAYNSFSQLISDAQSHSGAVGGGTPKVQYAYTNGSTNMIRPTTLTYPNGRAITISYGTSGGINDAVSRVDGLIDGGATTLVNYSYLGMASAVQVTYPEPSIQYTLLGSSSGNNPTTGDIYWGLDLFGRIVDSRWFRTGTGVDVDRIQYGYDRASNRIWRKNLVATAAGKQFDEFYHNDGLQRLKDMQRGTLNGTNTAIGTATFGQCWTLDSTGNWRGFNEASTGGAWTTVQSRSANTVNQITGISTTTGVAWASPTYDASGNMTTIPAVNGLSWPTLTVDDWQNLTAEGWGRMVVTPKMTATYDAWSRLVTLVDASNGDTVQENQYDVRNFRVMRLTYLSGALAETRRYYYTTNWRCVEERVSGTTAENQYVWGVRYIDDLVLYDRGAKLYSLQDANWNVTGVIDASGVVQERYTYSAYGQPLYLDGAWAPLPIQRSVFLFDNFYCGYRLDIATGLYQVRFRVYHPQLGRWCQRDLLDYVDGMSLYAAWFAPNDIDPFGLDWLDVSANFAAGWGDTLTFNATYAIRDVSGINSGIDRCSTAYSAGAWTGIVHTTAFGFAGGARAAGARATGREFSHWIPNRYLSKSGGNWLKNTFGKSIFNGNYVSPVRHFKHDPFRYPRGWRGLGPRYKPPLRQLDRIPNVYKGGATGAGYGTASAMAGKCGC